MAEDYIQKVPHPLNKIEETNYIKNINNLLNNLESLLKVDLDEMNDTKIIQSSVISELMLKLLLKRQQYTVKENTPLGYLIEFSKRNNILPSQCSSYLETIKTYRNQSANNANTSRHLTSTFLNAFMNYISWFNLNYPSKNRFKIEGCCTIINSKYNSVNSNNRQFNSIYEDIHTHFEERINTFECPHCRFTLAKGDNFCPNCGNRIENNTIESIFTNKFNELKDKYINKNINPKESKTKEKTVNNNYNPNNQEEILRNMQKETEEIKKMLRNLNKTVEGMDEKLDSVLNQLNLVQSHTEKLIKTAVTEEEIDRIIQVHTTQCAENILDYHRNISKDMHYYIEKEKLIKLFGQDSWEKLSDDSKTFLITSKFMYNHLSKLNENFDYSGICVLTTKALEVEIFKRFFSDFIEYLDKKYQKDYSKYHTALLHRNFKPLFPERFTMGSIAYVLCYKENIRNTENEKVNNKIILMEYCKNSIFSDYSEKEIISMLNYYAEQIELIKEKYRNPSAHRDQIKRVDAEECMDLIIDVEKLLKQMIDSFDY